MKERSAMVLVIWYVKNLLLKLFRAIVKIGKIPSTWKRGLIVPIYKGGPKDKKSCNS